LTQDRPLYRDIQASRRLCDSGLLIAAARNHVQLM
jgi:hypothetical protein